MMSSNKHRNANDDGNVDTETSSTVTTIGSTAMDMHLHHHSNRRTIRHSDHPLKPQLQQQQQQQPYCQQRGRHISTQILILIILFLFIVRIQIFNCNVLLKEYHDEITSAQQNNIRHPDHHDSINSGDKPRILVGIFSMDSNDGYMYRQRHRTLFQSWNDTRICSLAEYYVVKSRTDSHNPCEFVYTFVVGANPAGSTELLQVSDDATKNVNSEINTKRTTTSSTSSSSSWLVQRSSIQNGRKHQRQNSNKARDIESPDITLLNIRENMNDGKSQSWIAYSSTVLATNDEQSDFDYIAKWDDDSILLLPEYFQFVYTNLPSHKPYNSMFFIGTPFDKAHWEQNNQTDADHERVESLYENQYNRVHVYFGGQLYIMSIDLAQSITQEAIRSNCTYCEGVEDHDIASIAFHATSKGSNDNNNIGDDHHHPKNANLLQPQQEQPLIKLLFVGRHQQFWEHPIKTNDEWEVIWQRERQRIPIQP